MHLKVYSAHWAHIFYSLDFYGVFSLCQEWDMWLTWLIPKDKITGTSLAWVKQLPGELLITALKNVSKQIVTTQACSNTRRGCAVSAGIHKYPAVREQRAPRRYQLCLCCSLLTPPVLQGAADQMETLNQAFPPGLLLSGWAVNKGAEAAMRLELLFLPFSVAGGGLPTLCAAGYSQWGACRSPDTLTYLQAAQESLGNLYQRGIWPSIYNWCNSKRSPC